MLKFKNKHTSSQSRFFSYPFNVLLLIIFLQLISHANHLPAWLIWLSGALACYGYFSYKVSARKISMIVRISLVFLSLAIFLLYYKTNFSVDMAASFFLLVSILKFLELKHQKDVTLFIYVMLYLSAISFLFEQSFVYAFIQFLLVLASLYVLLCVNSGSHLLSYRVPWGSLFKATLIATPIVVFCFLFFPRIAPLWSIPIKSQNAITGMTNFMSPGDIASLAQSSERAFRVSFSLEAPQKKDLYWRGMVLDNFDGRAWRGSSAKATARSFKKVDLGALYDHGQNYYEVMLEANNQSWVYTLPSSRISSSNVLAGEAGQFELKTPAIQATRYKMTFKGEEGLNRISIPTAKLVYGNNQTSSEVKRLNNFLQVPLNSNKRTQQFVKELNQNFTDQMTLVNHLMTLFAQQKFFYTLNPPTLGKDTVDEFLFDSQRGFCAHYAGSLAYMLRLAKIPARVIAGYQGGEYNAKGGYYIIHQYDAHAWVEAKISGVGWVRLDPTAMVAPERVVSGLNGAIGEQGGFLDGSPMASTVLRISGLNWLRLRFDEFNYGWQKLVVNYGNDEQQSFVAKVFKGLMPGSDNIIKAVVLMVSSFGVLITSVLSFLWYKRYAGRYSAREKMFLLWLYLLHRLIGLERQIGETPRVFLSRVQSSQYSRLAKVTEYVTVKLEQDQYQRK